MREGQHTGAGQQRHPYSPLAAGIAADLVRPYVHDNNGVFLAVAALTPFTMDLQGLRRDLLSERNNVIFVRSSPTTVNLHEFPGLTLGAVRILREAGEQVSDGLRLPHDALLKGVPWQGVTCFYTLFSGKPNVEHLS